jgi:hypothetical protein
MRAVHGAVVQVQRVRAAEFGQQNGVQAWPDASLGPVSQPAPGRHPGAAHRLGRDIAPRDTGPQHEQDSGERHTVGNTQPSGDTGGAVRERAAAAEPPAPTGRQEQDQHAPGHPADQDRRTQDPQPDSF